MDSISDEAEVASPCVRQCALDQHARYCTGCYRTAREIARWSRASNAERRAILQSLARRREQNEQRMTWHKSR